MKYKELQPCYPKVLKCYSKELECYRNVVYITLRVQKLISSSIGDLDQSQAVWVYHCLFKWVLSETFFFS